ncbi:MAG TPA: hypothetical protein VMS65_00095 [Polyangiaceae bacterium]|nr:hypothetical protein [Polyangiaceae bacterium]
MRLNLAFSSFVLGLGLTVASPAIAAPKETSESASEEVKPDEEKSSADSASEGEAKEGEGDEKKEGGEPPVPPEDERKETSPVEHKGETYRFVGLRYRALLIPSFIMGLFGEGGDTILVHNFGPEFTIRKDEFEYSFAVTYSPYSMGAGPTSTDQVAFKDPNDPEEAWELVTSELKVLYLTADFVWSAPISSQVSFQYGGGAGIGFVFGDLYRTQAYKEDGIYKPCTAPGNPAVAVPGGAQYCGDDNDHYPGYTEPSWASGGSKPIIFPWIAIQTGLRWKPHRNFVGRLDAGIGLGQFFLGVGADYGI